MSEQALSERKTHLHDPIDLSIIMPCFNEAENIEKVLREWKQILVEEQIAHEIIVVNDGSSDGTGRILDRVRREMKGIKVIHQLNSGASRATRRGYELCKGRYILHTEATLRFEPLDFLRLWERREECPAIVAYRTHRLDSLFHGLLTRCQRFLLKRVINLDLHDPSVPFRLIRRDIATAVLRQIPEQTQAFNLWLSVTLSQIIQRPLVEVAVPFRKRLSCRIRRKHKTLLGRSIVTTREILTMRYGNSSRPGMPKLPAWPQESRA